MNKHTVGPWHKAEANTTIPIVSANGRTVCTIRYRENDNTDANLIAAAPDLLDALEHITEAYDSLLTAYGKAHGWGRIESDNARAAIAKVKGE